jgi:hypothetical protein
MQLFRHVPLFTVAFLALGLSGCSSESSQPLRTYGMGDRIELGHLVYTVFETRWVPQIGDGATARVPQDRFFLIRLSVGNSGGAEALVPDMTIEDDKGKSYAELTDGEGVPQFQGVLRPVAPTEAVSGNILFDAPPGHYRLHIFDEQSQRAALVDIPLTFHSESPDLPAADDAK